MKPGLLLQNADWYLFTETKPWGHLESPGRGAQTQRVSQLLPRTKWGSAGGLGAP